MEEIIAELFGKYGYIAIAGLIFAETVFPPIPSEIVLLMGGFMIMQGGMSLMLGITCATFGSLAGACLLYLCGRMMPYQRLVSLASGGVGRAIGLKRTHIDKSFEKFGKYRNLSVLICRCVPVVRSLISIPAGMSGMRFLPFALLTTIGSAVWNSLLMWLGALAGSEWPRIAVYINSYGRLIIFASTVTLAAGVCIYLIRKTKTD